MPHEDLSMGMGSQDPTLDEEIGILKRKLDQPADDPDGLNNKEATRSELARLQNIKDVIERGKILLRDLYMPDGITPEYANLDSMLKTIENAKCSDVYVEQVENEIRELREDLRRRI